MVGAFAAFLFGFGTGSNDVANAVRSRRGGGRGGLERENVALLHAVRCAVSGEGQGGPGREDVTPLHAVRRRGVRATDRRGWRGRAEGGWMRGRTGRVWRARPAPPPCMAYAVRNSSA